MSDSRAYEAFIQQNQENGERGVNQPARQHCLHTAETSGMAAHAVCWHRHPWVYGHWPGFHWNWCSPVCHFTEHPSVGGMTVTTEVGELL